ncbi:MAG: electron transfer flavoprotein subunit alpha/FixB family protein [Chloroflexi bacterium]|nr:electron transfer flavoprotein subunit alpha/FixB family protein [Chloroflexota bacterium]
MPGAVWAIGEVADGSVTRLSTEVATVARRLAADAGREAVGVVVAADATGPAAALAAFVGRVVAIGVPIAEERPAAAVAAARIAALARVEQPAWLIVGATPDGRDVAGMLAASLDLGVLANAVDVRWDAGNGPVVDAAVLGGRVLTTSDFTAGRGIILLAPNVVTAEPADAPGRVEAAQEMDVADLPAVTVVEHVSAAAQALSIEEASVIVAGGRGVGGPEGFRVVEELAELLGGAVGATRAAVDAGWIDYAQQVGQTGKTVRPALYLALGISGAIQHRVGMQAAETIIAVNRDPDAPLAEYADLFGVGDLFEVGPALAAEIRARRG